MVIVSRGREGKRKGEGDLTFGFERNRRDYDRAKKAVCEI
jgi:hypothetical protein